MLSINLYRYVRTRGGRMTHTAVCRYAQSKSAYPWNWAEGMDPEEVAYHSIVHGGDFHVQCFGELIAQAINTACSNELIRRKGKSPKTSFGDLSAIP